MKSCANCHTELPENARFCPGCGQKTTDGRIRMRDLLLNFWNTNFHLEGKFVKTGWELLIPGRVTKAFFEGRQQRYLGPLRMFAIAMFFFLMVLNHALETMNDGSGEVNFSINTERPDSIPESNTLQSEDFYLVGRQWETTQRLREYYDSLPTVLNTPEARLAFDSARSLASTELKFDKLAGLRYEDSASINLGFSSTKLPLQDIFKYSPDEIIERQGVTGWIDQIAIRQGIKLMRSPNTLIKAYLGGTTSGILLTVVAMAAIFCLFYRRPKRYYVEHFIFLLHFHTGAILLLLPLILLSIYVELNPFFLVVAFLLIWAGIWMALKRYYAESNLVTTLKWLILTLIYFIVVVAFSIAMLLLIFLVF
jgi:Protein of unknown function (DUF3667)